MEGEKNEVPIDIFKVFTDSWTKFVLWVKTNAHVLGDKEKEALLMKGIDRAPEFAFASMVEKTEEAPMGKLLKHRKAIEKRDEAYFLALAGETLDLTGHKFPEEIVAKGFDFAEVFLDLILELEEQ